MGRFIAALSRWVLPTIALVNAACTAACTPEGACPARTVVAAGQQRCGVGLTADGVVRIDGLPARGDAAPAVSSGVRRLARSLVLYRSPDARTFLVRACSGTLGDACVTCYILDRRDRRLTPLQAFFFCDLRDPVRWSTDSRRVSFIDGRAAHGTVVQVDARDGFAELVKAPEQLH